MILSRLICNSIPVIAFAICFASGAVDAKHHTFLRDGSRVVFEFESETFQWTDIDSATSSDRTIRWNDVEQMKLAESPASQQIEQMKRQLAQLRSSDYAARELAEVELSQPKRYGPFVKQIEAAVGTGDLESDYRLRRILARIGDYGIQRSSQFDELLLRDGTRLVGDAGNLAVAGRLFDHEIQLDRRQISQISMPQPDPQIPKAAPIQVKTFNRAIPDFYGDPSETVVNFEVDETGEPVGSELDAAELFAFKGILLDTEDIGDVITIRYPFKFCPVENGTRCICPRDSSSVGRPKRLQGTTIIQFCIPGQPHIAAGVRRFGLFLERIEHSRDVIVEAYSASGQMLGMVESTDEICTFAGFESSDPITRIRILQNPHLDELERTIDATYAIDCVTFDKPVRQPQRIDGSWFAETISTISFRDQNLLAIPVVDLGADSLQFESPLLPDRETVPLADVASIDFAYPDYATDSEDVVFVMLRDGSIVKTQLDNWLTPVDFSDQQLDEAQVVGLWPANSPARIAEQRVLEQNQPVLVFPGCQIVAADLQMLTDGLRWDAANSEKVVQEVHQRDIDLFDPEDRDPDLTPQFSRFKWSDDLTLPTVWLAQPQSTRDTAAVVLTDGQRFQIDGKLFSLAELAGPWIEISLGGTTKRYPKTRIRRISFPD